MLPDFKQLNFDEVNFYIPAQKAAATINHKPQTTNHKP
jgi:hypothetical protein